jgi:PIN domain
MSNRVADSGPLVFIDTNKWLRFYMGLREEQAVEILQSTEANASRLIMTEQVHVEFLKHRQQHLVEAIAKLTAAGAEAVLPPPVLRTPQSQVDKKLGDLQKAVAAERKHIEAILLKPRTHDAVFRLVTTLAESGGPLVLSRQSDQWAELRARARERWELGYPPRKRSETSYGDAINWEWIVSCAAAHERDVVIVSYDSDYGIIDKNLINDALAREFKKRTKRTVTSSSSLETAFKGSNIPLSETAAEAERATATAMSAAESRPAPFIRSNLDYLRNMLANSGDRNDAWTESIRAQIELLTGSQ